MSDPLTVIHGDALSSLKSIEGESVQMCVTSPAYWGLRDYGVEGQLGLEKTPEEYVSKLVEIFREVKRVLRKDGTVFLNLGDSYFGGGGHSPNAPSSATSKSGKYGATGALIKGHTSGSARRAVSYGTSGRALEDYQESGCLCRSLCDACRVAYQIGRSHSDRWPDPTRTALPSAPIRARKGSAPDRSPTSDSSLPAGRIADATQGFENCVDHERERLPASQASTTGESFLPRAELYLPNGNLDGECRLCGCSLAPYVPGFSGRTAGPSASQRDEPSTSDHLANTDDSAATGGSLVGHIADTVCDCAAYRNYTKSPRSIGGNLKPKDLVGIPWMTAFALRADGWYLRSDVIWSKPNPMPESVTDRPTKSHEYIFLLSKSQKYYYDADAIREEAEWARWGKQTCLKDYRGIKPVDMETLDARRDQGRNKRSVWTVATQPFSEWTKTSRRVRVELDAATDGSERIASQDCPLHGDSSGLAATAFCGERAGGPWSYSEHIDSRRASALQPANAPTDQRHAGCSEGESLDSLGQRHDRSATRHSSRTRKTDRAPETSQPCTPSAQTLFRTEHMSGERGSSGLVGRTPLSSIAADCASGETETSPSEQRLDRNESKCTCEHYNTITEEISHFATFPPKLIEPCILAGSKAGDIVLDPFGGSGTTGKVAIELGRKALLIELKAEYVKMIEKRCQTTMGFNFQATA